MVGRNRSLLLLCAVFALALIAAACSKDSGEGSGGDVSVTEKDFSISVDPGSVKDGQVKFDIKNEGPSTHEFVVFKTELPADQLPVKDGAVDEEDSNVEHIDEKEDITSGSSTDLTVQLEAGHYVLICNLPGHYQQGMHAEIDVT